MRESEKTGKRRAASHSETFRHFVCRAQREASTSAMRQNRQAIEQKHKGKRKGERKRKGEPRREHYIKWGDAGDKEQKTSQRRQSKSLRRAKRIDVLRTSKDAVHMRWLRSTERATVP